MDPRVKQLAEILKRRFPNLTVSEVLDIVAEILEVTG